LSFARAFDDERMRVVMEALVGQIEASAHSIMRFAKINNHQPWS
jgi:hypothetical protein